MAKEKTTNLVKQKILNKMSTTWAAIIAACTIFGFGFGTGYYIETVLKNIELNEVRNELNAKILEQKIDYEKIIQELNYKNQLLEIENGKLK